MFIAINEVIINQAKHSSRDKGAIETFCLQMLIDGALRTISVMISIKWLLD